MRELKFRYIYKNSSDGEIAGTRDSIWTIDLISEGEPSNYIDICLSSDWKVIAINQYTGLKDKNGKEIYEGDICKVLYSDWISKSDKDERSIEQYMFDISQTAEVVFNNNMFCFKFGDYYDYLTVGPYGQIIVIGNIYENPELLNK